MRNKGYIPGHVVYPVSCMAFVGCKIIYREVVFVTFPQIMAIARKRKISEVTQKKKHIGTQIIAFILKTLFWYGIG